MLRRVRARRLNTPYESPVKMAATAALGVKGSDVYRDAGDDRVTLSVKAVRGAAAHDLQELFLRLIKSGSDQLLTDAVVLAFQIRDVRGGRGERDCFYAVFEQLAAEMPGLAKELLALLPEYGCWRDLVHLAACSFLKGDILALFKKQLEADEAVVAGGATSGLSLAAKWAPREGNHYDALAKDLARAMAPTAPNAFALYRKRMAALNRVLKTVETYECSGRWDEIEPKLVPGRARQLKLAAYLNEKVGGRQPRELRHPSDPRRMACRDHFKEFLAAAAAGKQRLTGTDTVYPHELVRRCYAEPNPTPEERAAWNTLWSQMVEKVRAGGGLGSSIAMCDFSGSMGSTYDPQSPRNVALAMGLLVAAANSGPFHGKILGFSSDPEWLSVDVTAPLTEQVESVATGLCQGLSTDFQKAMDKVLDTLKAARTRPGEEPKNLIVLTDMGWDAACNLGQASSYTGNRYANIHKTKAWQTHIQMIREAFTRAGEDIWGEGNGWTPPRIVIWNLAAKYSGDFHAQADTEGVMMLAGWSPSLFKVLCEEGPKVQTPLETLRAQLDDPRYDAVRAVVRAWIEGGWRGGAVL